MGHEIADLENWKNSMDQWFTIVDSESTRIFVFVWLDFF